MSSFSKLVDNLDSKVRSLVDQKQALQDELEQLKKESQVLKQQNNEYAEKLEALEEKNKILRIAGGSSEGDKREIKLKINEIVREVDKCIAQLNQ